MDSTTKNTATDTVRETLRRIIEKHGTTIYASPKKLESLLRDLCGQHRREINIVTGAIEEGVAADLITKQRTMPRDVLLAQLSQRLQDNLAYTPDAALWAIETWAFALGVLSEQELETRAQKRRIVEPAPPVERTNQSAPRTPPPLPPSQVRQPKPTLRQPSPPTPVLPASPPTPARASTRISQPLSPPKTKPASPAIMRTTAAQAAPQVVIPPAPQIAVQPARRGFGWRGCLVTLLICVVLFIAGLLIVPPVIMQLREEQSRPSINEPRINR